MPGINAPARDWRAVLARLRRGPGRHAAPGASVYRFPRRGTAVAVAAAVALGGGAVVAQQATIPDAAQAAALTPLAPAAADKAADGGAAKADAPAIAAAEAAVAADRLRSADVADRIATRRAAAAAEAKKAAEAAAAAEAKAAAAKAVAAAQSDPRSAARVMLADFGWGAGEFGCLDSLWMKESGWRYTATNSSSGAYGIPQSLPASKMASAGADWQSNPATQIKWGLGYIKSVYGSPCAAWGHSQATNWY